MLEILSTRCNISSFLSCVFALEFVYCFIVNLNIVFGVSSHSFGSKGLPERKAFRELPEVSALLERARICKILKVSCIWMVMHM